MAYEIKSIRVLSPFQSHKPFSTHFLYIQQYTWNLPGPWSWPKIKSRSVMGAKSSSRRQLVLSYLYIVQYLDLE